MPRSNQQQLLRFALQTQDKEDEERLTDLVLGWDSTNYAYLKTCSHVPI